MIVRGEDLDFIISVLSNDFGDFEGFVGPIVVRIAAFRYNHLVGYPNCVGPASSEFPIILEF